MSKENRMVEKKYFIQSYGDLYESVMQGIAEIFKDSGKFILYFDDLKIKNDKDKYETVDAVQYFHDKNDDFCIVVYSKNESGAIMTINNSIACPIIPLFGLILIYEQIYKAYESIIKQRKDVKTVKLCGLEWMTENLSGHGGAKNNGHWYYTWDQAKKAAEEVGDGWRLPTAKEFEELCKLNGMWHNEPEGRFFGKNEELFLPANGFIMLWKNFGSYSCFNGFESISGNYWSNSFVSNEKAINLCFNSDGNLNSNEKSNFSWGYSVRLVRDIK